MKSPETQLPLIQEGQNFLTISIEGRDDIVVPRKELYGVPDIGEAIGFHDSTYIRNRLRSVKTENSDIKPQYLGISQRSKALFLSKEHFVLAVTAIILKMEGESSHKKESIILPDEQTIAVGGEKEKRVLRLLIDAFSQGKPYIPNEKPLGFNSSQGAPPNPMQTKEFYKKAVDNLRNQALPGTGWNIHSTTVNVNGVGSKGYTLKQDQAQKVDAPNVDTAELILQSILENKAVLKEVVTEGQGKTSILEKAKQQINFLDPQQKILFLEKTFAILSDSNPQHQDKRDASLELLNIIDLKSIEPKELAKTYIKAVSNLRENLNQDSDIYGEIDALLQAGKTIVPFIENSKHHIAQPWNRVAKLFTGHDRQKILNDIEEIRQLIPGKSRRYQANKKHFPSDKGSV
jgi:hypothetical protein